MKSRRGFVSNSSSSSFLIVGVNGDDELIARLAHAEGLKVGKDYEDGDNDRDGEEDASCGGRSGKVVSFYGGEGDGPYYAGTDIEEMMETMTLPEIRKNFRNQIKKVLKIEVPLEKIHLHYGEVSSY